MDRLGTLLAGIVLVLGGTGAAVATALTEPSAPAAPARPQLTGPLMPRGFSAGTWTLRDDRGRPVRIAHSRGRVAVITFLHSECTSTCPVTAQTIRGALDRIDETQPGAAEQVDAFAISVAPREDTPAHVRRFLREQRAGRFLRYLIGPRRALRAVWKRYGVAPNGEVGETHTAFILVADRRGMLRVGFPSHQVSPEELAHDLRVLLAERA
jgi:cytochrome oxidase Cu insertion factor (SCO1/SenC/PrrC family)